jgi:hypothetical protein
MYSQTTMNMMMYDESNLKYMSGKVSIKEIICYELNIHNPFDGFIIISTFNA